MKNKQNNSMLNEARKVARILTLSGYRAYFCGGAVRDRLLDLPVKDIDIATSAKPEQIQKLFPGSGIIGADFACVVVRGGKFNFDVVTFRRDSSFSNSDLSDGRKPLASVRKITYLDDNK